MKQLVASFNFNIGPVALISICIPFNEFFHDFEIDVWLVIEGLPKFSGERVQVTDEFCQGTWTTLDVLFQRKDSLNSRVELMSYRKRRDQLSGFRVRDMVWSLIENQATPDNFIVLKYRKSCLIVPIKVLIATQNTRSISLSIGCQGVVIIDLWIVNFDLESFKHVTIHDGKGRRDIKLALSNLQLSSWLPLL